MSDERKPLGLCCPMCGGKIVRLEGYDADGEAWRKIYDFAREHIAEHHNDGTGDWHRPDDRLGGFLAQEFRDKLYKLAQNLAHAFVAMRAESWQLHPLASQPEEKP